jgi:hypothetical protein
VLHQLQDRFIVILFDASFTPCQNSSGFSSRQPTRTHLAYQNAGKLKPVTCKESLGSSHTRTQLTLHHLKNNAAKVYYYLFLVGVTEY